MKWFVTTGSSVVASAVIDRDDPGQLTRFALIRTRLVQWRSDIRE